MTAPLPPLLPSQPATASKSTHLQDPLLLPFLAPSFSPTAYLNTSFPLPQPPQSTTTTTTPQPPTTTTTTTKPPPSQQPQSNSLTTITHQTTTHLSALSAQTSRLSTILTNLTDEILRRSARLGYEIEILQNQAEELVDALSLFLPNHPSPHSNSHNGDHPFEDSLRVFLPTPDPTSPKFTITAKGGGDGDPPPTPNRNAEDDDPIRDLRLLIRTRTALQSLKLLFSLAMQWEMPPSLLSSSSSSTLSTNPLASLATVTSPQTADTEKRGLLSLRRIRSEIEEMLDSGGKGVGGKGKGEEGVKRARARVAELRDCVGVWRGTSEEKARGRWVEEVGMWVEEEVRRRGLDAGREGESGGVGGVGMGNVGKEGVGGAGGGEEAGGRTGTGTGTGFLQRLREEIYME